MAGTYRCKGSYWAYSPLLSNEEVQQVVGGPGRKRVTIQAQRWSVFTYAMHLIR